MHFLPQISELEHNHLNEIKIRIFLICLAN